MNNKQKVDDTKITPAPTAAKVESGSETGFSQVEGASRAEVTNPETTDLLLARYGEHVSLYRTAGDETEKPHYYITCPRHIEIATEDPHLAWSHFVYEAVTEFVFFNFSLQHVFGENNPAPLELRGETGLINRGRRDTGSELRTVPLNSKQDADDEKQQPEEF